MQNVVFEKHFEGLCTTLTVYAVTLRSQSRVQSVFELRWKLKFLAIAIACNCLGPVSLPGVCRYFLIIYISEFRFSKAMNHLMLLHSPAGRYPIDQNGQTQLSKRPKRSKTGRSRPKSQIDNFNFGHKLAK